MEIFTFTKYEDLWWKDRMAFLFWKGNNGISDIHLICSPGEGSNVLENRFPEARRDHRSSWGAYTRQRIMVRRVMIGCWFMGLVAKEIPFTGKIYLG